MANYTNNSNPCKEGCTCGRHPNGKGFEAKTEKACLTCQTKFASYPSQKQKYCSMDCYPRPGWVGDSEKRSGAENTNWRGGRTTDGRGRTIVHAPDERGGRVYEYRLLAAIKIGRPLMSGEVVHHIDGDVTNNALDNLQVMTQSEHMTLHNTERRAKRAQQTT